MKQYEEEIIKLRKIIEMSKNGQTIGNIDLGSSIKMLNNNQGQSNNKGDESVDDLI